MRISVTGRAERFEPAERGTVRASVTFDGPSRAQVLAAATQTHGIVVERARAHAASGAATWWGSDNVVARVREHWEPGAKPGQGRTVRSFEATAAVTVKFADFSALADWTVDIAAMEGVSVSSVTWTLTDARRAAVVDEVRTAAVREAVQRAVVYAAAVGLTKVDPVAVFEDGLRPGVLPPGGGAPFGVAARAAAADSAAGGDGVEVRPRDISVEVTLSADFDAS